MEGHCRMAAPGETNQRLDHLEGNNVQHGHGHEKKSILNKVKDKAKKLKSKVKKTMKSSHGGSHEESHEGSSDYSSGDEEGEEEEEQDKTSEKSDENVDHVAKALAGLDTFGTRDMLKHSNKSTVEPVRAPKTLHNYKDYTPTEETIKENDVGMPSMAERAGEAMAEATESSLGLGKGQKKEDQVGEEKPTLSKLGESVPVVEDNVRQAAAPMEDYFHVAPEKAEVGKSWNQRASEGVEHGKEKLEEFGVHNGPSSTEKPGEEESQSLVGKAEDNVTEAVASVGDHFHATPEKEESGKPWSQKAYEGVDNAKEKLGVHNGSNFSEKAEESSQSLVGKAQDKVNEIGEEKELSYNEKPRNFTGGVISSASEIGSGVMKKASELAEGLKHVLISDQSREGECKEKEDKETQQQQSEGEEKAGQGYAQKLYAAKDVVTSKLGYGGKPSQQNNLIGEPKPADDIQKTGTEAVECAKESKESFKSTIVSKLSPGEDEKALSEAITEAVSNSARSVKDSIVGGFYGGSGKTSSTVDAGTSQSNTQSISSNRRGGKGIVDRVTGVVGSFLGRKQVEDAETEISSSSQRS
ncbi:hypothetical protein KI387_035929, partial [Taxus chinensis]